MAMAFKKAIKSLHQAGDLGKSFEECNLCPAAIFHFKFDELPDPSRSGPGIIYICVHTLVTLGNFASLASSLRATLEVYHRAFPL